LTDQPTSPRELLESLTRGLVDEPGAVVVKETLEDDGAAVLEVSLAQGDYGSVIGRGGRTAGALRTIVKAAAARQRRRVFVDIVDN
jgi:hypothetical protein